MISCGKCDEFANCAMGKATECGHAIPSQGYKWCAKCALTKGVCQRCGKPIPPKKKSKPRKRR